MSAVRVQNLAVRLGARDVLLGLNLDVPAGEFLVLLGAFKAAWPMHLAGQNLPLVLAVTAVSGVVLGALYMLRFALGFLWGAAKAPHHTTAQPLADLNGRERLILGVLVVAVFALGLFPDSPMRKTEMAARSYQQLVSTPRLPGAGS